MPWAVCFCITGERPQWLFYDEVSREANLALRIQQRA